MLKIELKRLTVVGYEKHFCAWVYLSSARLFRWEKNGSLQIDDWPIVEGVSPGNMKQLTTHGTIFIGKTPSEENY